MTLASLLIDPFDRAAGLLQEHVLIPLLWRLDAMQWEDFSYGWALFAVYGVAQVALTCAVCIPLERWRPVERWPDRSGVSVDILYTLLARIGLLPLFTFVLFWQAQVALNGWLADRGLIAPTLEGVFPYLLGRPVLTFLIYAIILDFTDYWRHRLSHRFRWWWALHSVHHAQTKMTFWSDDRNHVADDLIGAVWFGIIGLLIGIPPMQFPLLILVLKFLESLSHANARLGFGWLGERLLISPRFHRAHHGVRAAGKRSCNYGAILPWWDMIFGTADFSREFARTGDSGAETALSRGGWLSQQVAGLRRMLRFGGDRARGHV